MLLTELMAERGWEPEDVAAVLGEQGVLSTKGKPVSGNGVRMVAGRGMAVPPGWRKALGVPEDDGSTESQAGPSSAVPGADGAAPDEPSAAGRREQAPKRPDGAPIVVEAGARKRIAGAYKFAGAALAAGSGSNGVAAVWGDQSDPIADLWLQAAEDNPWAARFVNLMSAGGSVGDLAAAHLYLAGATLYVLGASIPGGDALFAKYSRHRPLVAEPVAAAVDEPAPDSVGHADPQA